MFRATGLRSDSRTMPRASLRNIARNSKVELLINRNVSLAESSFRWHDTAPDADPKFADVWDKRQMRPFKAIIFRAQTFPAVAAFNGMDLAQSNLSKVKGLIFYALMLYFIFKTFR
jgi:hypothetical protein